MPLFAGSSGVHCGGAVFSPGHNGRGAHHPVPKGAHQTTDNTETVVVMLFFHARGISVFRMPAWTAVRWYRMLSLS